MFRRFFHFYGFIFLVFEAKSLEKSSKIPIGETSKIRDKSNSLDQPPPQNRNVLFPFFLKKSPALKKAQKIQSNIRHFFVAQIC